jgi:hypothetical protein
MLLFLICYIINLSVYFSLEYILLMNNNPGIIDIILYYINLFLEFIMFFQFFLLALTKMNNVETHVSYNSLYVMGFLCLFYFFYLIK